MVRNRCYLRCWPLGLARQARSSRVYPVPGLVMPPARLDGTAGDGSEARARVCLWHSWASPAWNSSARHTAEGCGAGAASCAVLRRRDRVGLILAMIMSLIFARRGTICAWPERFEGDPGGKLNTGGDGSRMRSSCVVLDGHNRCTCRAEQAGTRLQYSTAMGAATFGHVEDFIDRADLVAPEMTASVSGLLRGSAHADQARLPRVRGYSGVAVIAPAWKGCREVPPWFLDLH
jgi:hypothetical protein